MPITPLSALLGSFAAKAGMVNPQLVFCMCSQVQDLLLCCSSSSLTRCSTAAQLLLNCCSTAAPNHDVGSFASVQSSFHLYTREVIHVSPDVSYLLVIPSTQDMVLAPGQEHCFDDSSDVLYLPLHYHQLSKS